MTALAVAGSAVLGLVVGSFLNVVIYRVPARKSIVRPSSCCPNCGHVLTPGDNIPVLSWLLLKGRCRYCATPIPARYPFVELLTAGLWVLVALRFGWSWTLPPMAVFVSGLVALAFIDLDHMLLPRSVIYVVGVTVLSLLGLAAAIEGTWHRLGVAVVCGAVEYAALWVIVLVSPGSIGRGDVRFVALIGLSLGWLGWWYAFFGFVSANLVGALFGVGLIAAGRAGLRTKLPYGVFLAIGAVLAIALAGTLMVPRAR